MCGEKTQQVIEYIKNMSDKEADIFEAFLAGFKAGKQMVEAERGNRISGDAKEKTA